MAEETKGEELPPADTPQVEQKPQVDKNGKARRDAKKDETPVEELFDLSKPIPRVREPHNSSPIDFVDFYATDFLEHFIFLIKQL